MLNMWLFEFGVFKKIIFRHPTVLLFIFSGLQAKVPEVFAPDISVS